MPLPSPKKDESRNDFNSRCMSDSVMNSEFPDQSQRFTVCRSIWDKKKTEDMAEEFKSWE